MKKTWGGEKEGKGEKEKEAKKELERCRINTDSVVVASRGCGAGGEEGGREGGRER